MEVMGNLSYERMANKGEVAYVAVRKEGMDADVLVAHYEIEFLAGTRWEGVELIQVAVEGGGLLLAVEPPGEERSIG